MQFYISDFQTAPSHVNKRRNHDGLQQKKRYLLYMRSMIIISLEDIELDYYRNFLILAHK
jgi:hypothetical protein